MNVLMIVCFFIVFCLGTYHSIWCFLTLIKHNLTGNKKSSYHGFMSSLCFCGINLIFGNIFTALIIAIIGIINYISYKELKNEKPLIF